MPQSEIEGYAGSLAGARPGRATLEPYKLELNFVTPCVATVNLGGSVDIPGGSRMLRSQRGGAWFVPPSKYHEDLRFLFPRTHKQRRTAHCSKRYPGTQRRHMYVLIHGGALPVFCSQHFAKMKTSLFEWRLGFI